MSEDDDSDRYAIWRKNRAKGEFAFKKHTLAETGNDTWAVSPQRKIKLPLSKDYPDGLSAQIVYSEPPEGSEKEKSINAPISKLRATQESVSRGNPISKKESRRDWSPTGSDLPTGIRHPNGEIHLTDGHHRADAAKRRGDKTLRMKVIDIDWSKHK